LRRLLFFFFAEVPHLLTDDVQGKKLRLLVLRSSNLIETPKSQDFSSKGGNLVYEKKYFDTQENVLGILGKDLKNARTGPSGVV